MTEEKKSEGEFKKRIQELFRPDKECHFPDINSVWATKVVETILEDAKKDLYSIPILVQKGEITLKEALLDENLWMVQADIRKLRKLMKWFGT